MCLCVSVSECVCVSVSVCECVSLCAACVRRGEARLGREDSLRWSRLVCWEKTAWDCDHASSPRVTTSRHVRFSSSKTSTGFRHGVEVYSKQNNRIIVYQVWASE